MSIFLLGSLCYQNKPIFFFKKRRHSSCSLLLTYPFIKLLVSNGDLLELDEKACENLMKKPAMNLIKAPQIAKRKTIVCSYHHPSLAIICKIPSLPVIQSLSLISSFFLQSNFVLFQLSQSKVQWNHKHWRLNLAFPIFIHLPSQPAPTRKIFYQCNSVVEFFTCMILKKIDGLSPFQIFPLTEYKKKFTFLY